MRIITEPRPFAGMRPKPDRTPPKTKQPIKQVSDRKRERDKEEAPEKAEMDLWFAARQKECIGVCSECGHPTNKARENIAHILPKRKTYGFPSVKTHPLNWVELCKTCHQDFDNKHTSIVEMHCFDFMLDCFIQFYPAIAASERYRIPEVLLQELTPEEAACLK